MKTSLHILALSLVILVTYLAIDMSNYNSLETDKELTSHPPNDLTTHHNKETSKSAANKNRQDNFDSHLNFNQKNLDPIEENNDKSRSKVTPIEPMLSPDELWAQRHSNPNRKKNELPATIPATIALPQELLIIERAYDTNKDISLYNNDRDTIKLQEQTTTVQLILPPTIPKKVAIPYDLQELEAQYDSSAKDAPHSYDADSIENELFGMDLSPLAEELPAIEPTRPVN